MSQTTAYRVSPELLARDDFRAACAARDFGQMFRLMRKWDGASQDRIASPIGSLSQSRVSRITRDQDRITSLHLIERIVDALGIPGTYVGLNPRPWENGADSATRPKAVGTASATASGVTAPSVSAPSAPTTGEVVETRLSVDLDIAADGTSLITYSHTLDNRTQTPYTRFTRELWFAIADGPLQVTPVPGEDRNVLIHRTHETPAHLAYACQVSPALQPGETATVAYTCTGGVFGAEHYWRQAIVSHVEDYEIRVRLRGVDQLTACTAIEERADGSEVSATETLVWRRDGDDLVIELTRKGLEPNQFVTLRWDFPRATA
jgi:hypothetical protein